MSHFIALMWVVTAYDVGELRSHAPHRVSCVGERV